MGFWKKLLAGLRVGAAVAESQGVKVKGIPIGTIRDVAEREGGHIANEVKSMKDRRTKAERRITVRRAPPNSTGE